MSKIEADDFKADQVCMDECVKSFVKLSRHYCRDNDADSVATGQAKSARNRTLQYVVMFIQDHPWL